MFCITQTAIIEFEGKVTKYKPLYLFAEPVPRWSGNVKDALKFPTARAAELTLRRTITQDMMANPGYEYGVIGL